MAAPSISDLVTGVVGNRRVSEFTVTPSTTYLTATPSETISLASIGLKTVDEITQPSHRLNDASRATTAALKTRGFTVSIASVSATHLNLRYWETSGTEVADAVDKSTETYRLRCYGT